MKRIFYALGIAAMAMMALSCNKDKGGKDDIDIDNIVEDGVYVVIGGEVKAEYAMAKGINEADNQSLRVGMYEKYIVLEAGQEFTLTYKAGDSMTKYGATLTEFTPTDFSGIYDSNPAIPVLKGALVEGESAPTMKAGEKGLYHIVLDLNLDKKLENAQILVAKTQYGVRGGMNSWGFTALEGSELSNAGTTLTITEQALPANGEFKFAYNSAWKITLDTEGAVKANTNLGDGCKPGGDNIKVADAGVYTITLTYKLAAGDIANSFNYEVTRTGDLVIKDDPSTYIVGLSGGNLESGWGVPANSCRAEFKSTTATAGSTTGQYVFEIPVVNIPLGTMKIRFFAPEKAEANSDGWYGVGEVEVEGLEYTGDAGQDFNVTKDGAYKVTFTLDWENSMKSLAVKFERIGDLLLDPSTFKVGVSGGAWKDGSTDWGWNDPFTDINGVTTLATFKSKDITDNAKLAGTYVWELESLPIPEGYVEFKLRCGGDWVKATESSVEGLEGCASNGTDDPSWVLQEGHSAAGNYKVTLTIVWNGSSRDSFNAKFEKL